MSSVTLRQTYSLFHSFRFTSRIFVPSLLSPFALSPSPFRWSIPSLQSLLELFPPFLLAVPKKKVSHSRKSMRSANKGLKDKHNIVNCPACGTPKLAHHLCEECYSSMTRERKMSQRLDVYERIVQKVRNQRRKPEPTTPEPATAKEAAS